MSQVFVGTAYHQVYCIPLCLKTPIIKLGEKKRCPVTSIFLPHPQSSRKQEIDEQILDKTVYYSDPSESFCLFRTEDENFEISNSQKLPFAFVEQTQRREKILGFEKFRDRGIYYTSHGNIYVEDSKENPKPNKTWCKLYYNEVYENRMKSLPKQGVGKLRPEYTCVKIYQRQNLQVAFAGRGVLPFVYEANQHLNSVAWKAKNITNDELDLQVPIEDVDICFLKLGCHIACLSAQNKIRIYDVRSRRRKPISDIHLTEVEKADNKSKLTKLCVSKCENYFYVANVRGSIYQLDANKNYQIIGKFKGITTTIKDMVLWGDKLVVISLDGYLRIFNTNTKQKQFERYLNTHPEVLKLAKQGIMYPQVEQPYQIEQMDLKKDAQKQQKEVLKKVKKIRKRNKVGLKYVKNANFDDVKLENNEGQPEDSEMKQEIQKKQDIEDQDLDL